MASDKGSPKDGMDERLAQARDAALFDAEEIIGQETGDQGQAIIITNNRILIIKSGLTATGVLNGQTLGSFAFDKITAVNVRKGPMGAVIQICTDVPAQATSGGTPENVIVFSGDQRIKKCDIIAEKIESALGRPVERFEPKAAENIEETADSTPDPSEAVVEETPKRMRGGREAKSLAEEMFEEMTVAEVDLPKPESIAEPVPAQPVVETVAEQPEQTVEQIFQEPEPEVVETRVEAADSFRPNPNLPKPVKKKSHSNKSFLLVGGLMVLVLIGMAVMSPLRHPKPLPSVEINVDNLTRNSTAVRKQISEVQNYRKEVVEILAASNKEAASLSVAIRSGRKAIFSAAGNNASDKAWQKLANLKVPSGLAGAKENLVLGIFTRKNAVANALSVGPVDTTSIIARLRESDALINRGLASIGNMEAGLSRQLYSKMKKTEK